MLIVEDDATFARTVLEVARERGFKGIVALRGDAGLALAHEFKPDAIVLDMKLPVMDGWTVLDHLKHHPATRHIPVHIVSAGERRQDERAARRRGRVPAEAAREGAPRRRCSRRSRRSSTASVRSLLVVEDDDDQRNAIVELVGGGDDVEVTAVGSSDEALAAARARRSFDCMVLDLKLPDTTGFKLLEQLKKDERYSTPAGDRLHRARSSRAARRRG